MHSAQYETSTCVISITSFWNGRNSRAGYVVNDRRLRLVRYRLPPWWWCLLSLCFGGAFIDFYDAGPNYWAECNDLQYDGYS